MSAPTVTAALKRVLHARAEYIPGIESQVLIQVTIDAHDKIQLYPHPDVPVVIFRKRGRGHAGWPDQIRWVVSGLRGRTLRIRPKDPRKAVLFPNGPFRISQADNTIRSGKAAHAGTWKYSIELHDGHHLVDRLDPTIEIIEDP